MTITAESERGFIIGDGSVRHSISAERENPVAARIRGRDHLEISLLEYASGPNSEEIVGRVVLSTRRSIQAEVVGSSRISVTATDHPLHRRRLKAEMKVGSEMVVKIGQNRINIKHN